jgi:hypothetical protein
VNSRIEAKIKALLDAGRGIRTSLRFGLAFLRTRSFNGDVDWPPATTQRPRAELSDKHSVRIVEYEFAITDETQTGDRVFSGP